MFGARGFNRFAHPALALVLAGAIGVFALAGCSDDENPSNPGGGTPSTTTFVGMFASGTESGRLSATVNTTTLARRWNGLRAPKAIITATGAAVINGSTYTLLGTYDTSTDEIDITGGGYSFSGQYSVSAYGRPSITGTWTGPGGAYDVGEFVCHLGTLANVKAYCGIYNSTPSASDSGSFAFTVIDTILIGVVHEAGTTGGAGLYFEGTVTGSANPRVITINYTNPGNFTLFAPGTVDTVSGDVAGTYTYTDIVGGGTNDDAGTYTGDLCP